MTTRQKRCFNFDKTLILECSVECFTQVKTPCSCRSPYQDIRGPNITEFLLPSFPAFRPKSSGILYFLSRFVQIPYYSHCKYFVILCTSFFIHGQNLESEELQEITQSQVTLGPDSQAGFNLHALRAYSHNTLRNHLQNHSKYLFHFQLKRQQYCLKTCLQEKRIIQ